MALDPKYISDGIIFIGTVLSSVGVTWGGAAALAKRKAATAPQPSEFCAEHHKCFQEIKDAIGDVKTDVAYIRGAIDKR
jgi:hypothetical protein